MSIVSKTVAALRFAVPLVLLCAVGAGDADEFYKWVDKDGNVHYTNDPGSIDRDHVKRKETLKMPDPPTGDVAAAQTVREGDAPGAGAGGPGFEKGDVPPDFTITSLSGLPYNLREQTGKIVLLNFWATWCGPCRNEMPSMQALYEKMNRRDFAVLAVSSEKRETVGAFVREHGYTFPTLIDGENISKSVYGITRIPTTFILDRKGKIVYRVTGGIDWNAPQIVKWFSSLSSL